MAPGVCITATFRSLLLRRTKDFGHLQRGLLLRSTPTTAISVNSWIHRREQGYCKYTGYYEDTNTEGEVCVEYIQGLPHLTVPLPSRNEKCRFALKPVSHTVGDLVTMLKIEDRGIDRATVISKSGIRVASTCNIESLLDDEFWLQINDNKYKIQPPPRPKIEPEDMQRLGDIRALVAQLYEALNVGEYHIVKEQELTKRLEDLKYSLTPLEKKKEQLSVQADRRWTILSWLGLSLMGVQFGVLARLTWWEYSWDIMEPVTYFVTYGTIISMYAYYCVNKSEYEFSKIRDREYLLHMYKSAKKINFDIDKYNILKRQIAEIEYDLRRLRDPLNLQLPPHVDRSIEKPPLSGCGDDKKPKSPTSDESNNPSSPNTKGS